MHTAYPVRTRATTLVDDLAFTLCLAIFALAPAAFAAFADAGPSAEASPAVATAASGPQHPAATFTGTYVDGAPVYRLPAITVEASREVEMARIEHADKPARSPGANDHSADQG